MGGALPPLLADAENICDNQCEDRKNDEPKFDALKDGVIEDKAGAIAEGRAMLLIFKIGHLHIRPAEFDRTQPFAGTKRIAGDRRTIVEIERS